LGLSDIHTLEDLARVKATVAKSVRKSGWAILNADDAHCVKIGAELSCNVAYFSLSEDNPLIKKLCAEGKTVAVYENGFITIKKGEWKIRIERATHVPLTLGGKAKFMIANVLAATLASYLYGFKTDDISLSLKTFIPSATQTPGRMNIFEFKKFKVLIDFAHNPSGYRGVEEYLQSVSATKKIGIIAGVGDRRDEDIKECGLIAGRMFDHIIIRQEKYLRGRTEEEIINLILEGISESGKTVTHEIISIETEAIKHAIDNVEDGSFITALSDVVTNAIEIVQDYLDKENEEGTL
jgi:cyanophycin synthetase